ncbi:MAG: hypothetical protein M3Y07_04975 [Acidobacteriota bacterium]|nr:hypothetical protein [Acidobacteriota bacterium]
MPGADERKLYRGSLFGGIFVIGTGNTIAHNVLSRLNLAHCDTCYFDRTEPELLKSGIYLGKGAERADMARDNVIEDNRISGYKMSSRCIGAAPGVSLNKNTVRRNNCSDEEILSAHVTREGSRSSMERDPSL